MAVDERQIWKNGNTPPLLLALTGGGFRGYFTALVLARLEELLNAPCCKVFDLIAGTSIGGIIALALSNGVRAQQIAAKIREKGLAIFPDLWFSGTRRFIGPPYNTSGIADALRELLAAQAGNALNKSQQRVMVATVYCPPPL